MLRAMAPFTLVPFRESFDQYFEVVLSTQTNIGKPKLKKCYSRQFSLIKLILMGL